MEEKFFAGTSDSKRLNLLKTGAVPKTGTASKSCKKMSRKVSSTPIGNKTLSNFSLQCDISSISRSSASFDEEKLNGGRKVNQFMKKKKMFSKSEENLDYLYGQYLNNLYYKAALNHEYKKEKKSIDGKLLSLENEVIKKEDIHSKNEKMKNEVDFLIQVQIALEEAKFSSKLEKDYLSALACNTDLEKNNIQNNLQSHLCNMKLEKIELQEDALRNIKKCLEEISKGLEEYRSEMKTEQILDANLSKIAMLKDKLQTLGILICNNGSLNFTLKGI